MSNTDQIHRFIFDDADIRGEIVTLQSSYQAAIAHQSLPPVAQMLLGEFLAAASLICDVLKFTGTLTIQARGDGPIPLIMADINNQRDLRGIAKVADGIAPDSLNDSSLAQLIGNGVLTLTMDPEQGKRYQGIVELTGKTLADCLSTYFAQSEQLPTRLWLFSDLKNAGGLLLQSLPPQSSQEPTSVPESDSQNQWNTAEQLAGTTTLKELFEVDHATLLVRLFNEFNIRLFEPNNVQFACQCSQERCGNSLLSLGKTDAFALLAERDIIEINCEFCGSQYVFDNAGLNHVFGNSSQTPH